MKRICVVSDVDGCLTNGNFIYTEEGKIAKIFGPHDNDGAKLLRKNGIDIIFISADKRGFLITKKRIEDMKCQISNVSEVERVNWIREWKAEEHYDVIIFFGDGIGDAQVKKQGACDWFVCPANARPEAKKIANYITEHEGGNGALLDLAYAVINEYIPENEQKDLYE